MPFFNSENPCPGVSLQEVGRVWTLIVACIYMVSYWVKVSGNSAYSLQSWHICKLLYKWMTQGWWAFQEFCCSLYSVTFIKLWTRERLDLRLTRLVFKIDWWITKNLLETLHTSYKGNGLTTRQYILRRVLYFCF